MAVRPTATNEPLRVDAAPVKGVMGGPVVLGGITLKQDVSTCD